MTFLILNPFRNAILMVQINKDIKNIQNNRQLQFWSIIINILQSLASNKLKVFVFVNLSQQST